MLVDPDDSAVDHCVFKVRIAGQATENPFEGALQRPSAETLEDRIPVPETRVQIAPRRACPGNPKHRFEKESVVVARATGVADLARQQRRNPLPLCIVQDSAIQDWPPFSSLESDLEPEGNPLRSNECQQALARRQEQDKNATG